MSIVNQDKPITSLTNPTKVVNYETWDSNTSTWDTETRTWNEMGTVWSNQSLSTDPIWSYRNFPWLMTAPWQQTGGIINSNKP
jgi:hypothetical protein